MLRVGNGGAAVTVRRWLLCVAGIMLLAAGSVAYRQISTRTGCPAGQTPMKAGSTGPPVRWAACVSWGGTVMSVRNTGSAVLLVSPQDGATLTRVTLPPPATPEGIAGRSLSAGAPVGDLQAAGLPTGWLYVAPGQVAWATGGAGVTSTNAAAVTVQGDFEATARWVLARSIAGWAQGQRADVDPQDVVEVSLACGDRLRMPATYRRNPPDLVAVIGAAVDDHDCRGVLHTLAPVDDSATAAYAVTDMAAQFAHTLPAGGWPDIAEDALWIFRAQ